MKNAAINPKDIPGYGMDADPENDPTYPMKTYTGDDHKRLDYERSEQQNVNIEVLKSTERPNITRVFGTSTPPSGLSGAIRRYAFKHSEDRYRHWIPLILADRVNVYEGVLDDLKRGHIPNIFSERGFKSSWEHNREGVIKKAIIATLATVVLVAFLRKKKR